MGRSEHEQFLKTKLHNFKSQQRRNDLYHSQVFQGGDCRAKDAFTICRFVPSLLKRYDRASALQIVLFQQAAINVCSSHVKVR